MTVAETSPMVEDPKAQPPAEQPDPAVSTAVVGPRRHIEMGDRGIMLRSLEELYKFAKMVLEAGAAPKGMAAIGQVAVAIQMGLERGLSPLAGMRAVYFVNGLPSWRGEAAAALVRQSPLCLSYRAWVEGEGEDRRGVCVTHRAGEKEAHRTDFSVRDAMKAGLWKKAGPWQEYPDRQLKWRAIGFNLRDQFSDVLGGFPIEEEAKDYPEQAVAAPKLDRSALAPPPSTEDPLLAQIRAATAAPAPVPLPVVAAVVVEPATTVRPPEPETDAAPFASHAEADRAIAKAEAATPGCEHRAALEHLKRKPAATVACLACGEELHGPKARAADVPAQKRLV